MPLRKNKDAMKVARTRKKSVEKAKEATPEKKEAVVEYHCKAYFKYDKLNKKQQYAIQVKTEKQFTALNYKVSVDIKKKGDTIDLYLLGLKTEQAYLVEPKAAESELIFDELYGKYTVNVIKQDGAVNTAVYDFNIYSKEIKLLEEYVPKKKNNRRFCTFETDSDMNSFGEKE